MIKPSKGRSLMFRDIAQKSERYPHDDVPAWMKSAVVRAIQTAWQRILSSCSVFVDELEANAILRTVLNNLRASGEVKGFNAELFQTVVTDGTLHSYNGASLDKKPDLAFRRADSLDENDAWFVECKILDKAHSQRLYYVNGVKRFEDGQYAWTMPSAVMVGYADLKLTLPASLFSRIAVERWKEFGFKGCDMPAWTSSHERSWTYLGTKHGPGPILLVHVWLRGATFGS